MTANEKRLAAMRANLANLEKKADDILAKIANDTATAAERLALLSLVNVAYHDSGKIETIFSIDSTASCEFCEKMRAAAENNPLMICGGCYAAADSWKEAAWRRHKLNARILSSVLFTEAELSTLAIPGQHGRINEDGDTVNQTHGQNIIRIIKTHPATFFGYWYKNTPAVKAALQAEGITTREARPANVKFIKSSVLIGVRAVPDWFTDAVFTVYPDEETTLAAIAAGEFTCNGRKCLDCGYNCYSAANGVQYIAEVLRASKAKRAAIRCTTKDQALTRLHLYGTWQAM